MYEKQLASIDKAFQREMCKIGDAIRRRFVLPACRKHGLTFRPNDNGGITPYVFYKDGLVHAENGTRVPELAAVQESIVAKAIPGFLDERVVGRARDAFDACEVLIPREAAIKSNFQARFHALTEAA